MNIVAIYGNTRHGSTWHCMDLVKQEISRHEEINIKEFSLPKDMPHFCNGCFSCIMNGENTCPHAASVHPIVTAMEEADLIVLTSPAYGMDVSGQMKALLDHLCFMWMSHRPNPKMFSKVGLIITTTAGVGLSHTIKTMKNSMKFWGVKRIYTYKKAVAAMKWQDIHAKKQACIQKETAALAKDIARAVHRVQRLRKPFFRSFFFAMMKGMMKKNTWNLTDRNHWVSQGWLSGKKPF